MNDHQIEALVGSTFQDTYSESIGLSVAGFSSDALLKNSGAGTIVNSRSFSNTKYRYNAIYARIGYSFKEKYVINITGRRDGSSRFGPGRQFGNFGAVGVAWLFHKESFVKDNVGILSYGKLRGSIGKTGNDQLQDYQYLSIYAPQGGQTYGGLGLLRPTNLNNPTYGWETINKIEAGVELGFAKDQVMFNVNYFRHRTANQLVGYPLPTITGFASVIANLPAVIQNSGFEFDISINNIYSSKFSWRTTANFTIPRNKLVEYPNLQGSPYSSRYAVGAPLSVQFGYVYTGIDSQTGIYTFQDINKDGEVTSTFDRVPIFYGTKFSGGITNTVTYGQFSLDFMLHYAKQYGYSAKFFIPPGWMNYNQQRAVLDRWTDPNSPGKYQKYTTVGDAVFNAATMYQTSNMASTNNEFLRLRNVMISWVIPEKALSSIGVKNGSIYAQGQNLFILTKFKGLDPETSQIGGADAVLPPLRTFTIGLKAGF